MKILSHRGYWKTPAEKNSAAAFERSFALGFGTETDLRDRAGELVISHDLPRGGELTVREFLEIYSAFDRSLPLALNIKADGLQEPLRRLLEEFAVREYFLFDMAIPDALVCLRSGLKCFTRQSEYEPSPAFYDQADGVWVDGFHGEWWDESLIRRHLEAGKRACLVSPELHRRCHLPFWQSLRGWECRGNPALMLCTDLPEDARAFFEQ
ncbi:MAG TPA: hypothetical protein VIS74_07900 [Chthoniobacterales bacterium]